MNNAGRIHLSGKDAEEFRDKVGQQVSGMFKGKIKELRMCPDYGDCAIPTNGATHKKEPKDVLHVEIDVESITKTSAVRSRI
jgi:hypothetical protein